MWRLRLANARMLWCDGLCVVEHHMGVRLGESEEVYNRTFPAHHPSPAKPGTVRMQLLPGLPAVVLDYRALVRKGSWVSYIGVHYVNDRPLVYRVFEELRRASLARQHSTQLSGEWVPRDRLAGVCNGPICMSIHISIHTRAEVAITRYPPPSPVPLDRNGQGSTEAEVKRLKTVITRLRRLVIVMAHIVMAVGDHLSPLSGYSYGLCSYGRR